MKRALGTSFKIKLNIKRTIFSYTFSIQSKGVLHANHIQRSGGDITQWQEQERSPGPSKLYVSTHAGGNK